MVLFFMAQASQLMVHEYDLAMVWPGHGLAVVRKEASGSLSWSWSDPWGSGPGMRASFLTMAWPSPARFLVMSQEPGATRHEPLIIAP